EEASASRDSRGAAGGPTHPAAAAPDHAPPAAHVPVREPARRGLRWHGTSGAAPGPGIRDARARRGLRPWTPDLPPRGRGGNRRRGRRPGRPARHAREAHRAAGEAWCGQREAPPGHAWRERACGGGLRPDRPPDGARGGAGQAGGGARTLRGPAARRCAVGHRGLWGPGLPPSRHRPPRGRERGVPPGGTVRRFPRLYAELRETRGCYEEPL
ncbi:MAG: hypothetical protein AVDCRST_MAG03-3854, partial [uncultured Rubrobacteraceae bacterium]